MDYQSNSALEKLAKIVDEKNHKIVYEIQTCIRSLYDEKQRVDVDRQSARKELEFVRAFQQERIAVREFFLWLSGLSILGLVITVCFLAFKTKGA